MSLPTIISAYIHKNLEATGYQITRYLEEKTGHNHQQVYRELKKLESAGRLSHRIEPQEGKPDRKVYFCPYDSNGFVYESEMKSDLRKTKTGYTLLIEDILYGTNRFDGYVKAMESAEQAYIKEEE